MSGKIILQNADGSAATKADGSALDNPTQQTLYSPVTQSAFDTTCGTTGASAFTTGGANACTADEFISGAGDETDFEKCLHAIDCKMTKEMRVKGFDSHASEVVTFVQQMIPHHANAVNMAKLLMKEAPGAVGCIEDLEATLWNIVNVQNYQIHQFRNYLAGVTAYTSVTDDAGNNLDAESVGHHCDGSGVPTALSAASAGTFTAATDAGCTPGTSGSTTTLCTQVNLLASETGYYQFGEYPC